MGITKNIIRASISLFLVLMSTASDSIIKDVKDISGEALYISRSIKTDEVKNMLSSKINLSLVSMKQ